MKKFNNIKTEGELIRINSIVCDKTKIEITFDDLLNKYGPEGLYEIANKLKQIADEDVLISLKQI